MLRERLRRSGLDNIVAEIDVVQGQLDVERGVRIINKAIASGYITEAEARRQFNELVKTPPEPEPEVLP